jgi:hypothetical protein
MNGLRKTILDSLSPGQDILTSQIVYVSHIASNDMMTMNDDLERIGKEMAVAYIYLKGLRE